MKNFHKEKVEQEIMHKASEFIRNEANYNSMITVTGIRYSDNFKKVSLLVSVLPNEKEEAALDFLKRKRSDFKTFIKENTKIGIIPFFDFEIDTGEKSRQRIEEISNNL